MAAAHFASVSRFDFTTFARERRAECAARGGVTREHTDWFDYAVRDVERTAPVEPAAQRRVDQRAVEMKHLEHALLGRRRSATADPPTRRRHPGPVAPPRAEGRRPQGRPASRHRPRGGPRGGSDPVGRGARPLGRRRVEVDTSLRSRPAPRAPGRPTGRCSAAGPLPATSPRAATGCDGLAYCLASKSPWPMGRDSHSGWIKFSQADPRRREAS